MPAKTGPKQDGRKDTRFKPGTSGNPNGRPEGSRNKATLAAQALLDGEAEALTRQCIEMALSGDTTALRLCLERICPPSKSRPVCISLPRLDSAASIAKAHSVRGRSFGRRRD